MCHDYMCAYTCFETSTSAVSCGSMADIQHWKPTGELALSSLPFIKKSHPFPPSPFSFCSHRQSCFPGVLRLASVCWETCLTPVCAGCSACLKIWCCVLSLLPSSWVLKMLVSCMSTPAGMELIFFKGQRESKYRLTTLWLSFGLKVCDLA